MSKPKDDPFQLLGFGDVDDDDFLFSKKTSILTKQEDNPLSFFNFSNDKKSPIKPVRKEATPKDTNLPKDPKDNPFSFFKYETKEVKKAPLEQEEELDDDLDDLDDDLDSDNDSFHEIDPQGDSLPTQHVHNNTTSKTQINTELLQASGDKDSLDDSLDDFEDDDLDDDIDDVELYNDVMPKRRIQKSTNGDLDEVLRENNDLKKRLEDAYKVINQLKEKDTKETLELNKALEMIENNLKSQILRADRAEKRNMSLTQELKGAHQTIMLQEKRIQDIMNLNPNIVNPVYQSTNNVGDVDWVQIKERNEFIMEKMNQFKEEAKIMCDIVNRNMKSFDDVNIMIKEIGRISEMKEK